jgi:hypothetical protein
MNLKIVNIVITKKNNLEFYKNMNSQIFINLFGLYINRIYDNNIEKNRIYPFL